MIKDVSRRKLWRLVSAGTLLTLLGWRGSPRPRDRPAIFCGSSKKNRRRLRKGRRSSRKGTALRPAHLPKRPRLKSRRQRPRPLRGPHRPVRRRRGKGTGSRQPVEDRRQPRPEFYGQLEQSPRPLQRPVTWTDRSNEYQLNQAWLYLERATDTTKQDFDLGDGSTGSSAPTPARHRNGTGKQHFSFNNKHAFYGFAFAAVLHRDGL